MLRIGAAFGAEFFDRNFVLVQLFLAVLLLDLPFNRQPVAIPAGHIRRVFTEQALRAADHVFQNMVQRMADVHVAIGIRRAIMQDELLPPRPRFAHFMIQVLLVPARQNARLLLRQAGLHGEIGLRQEDSVFEVFWFSHVGRALGEACQRIKPYALLSSGRGYEALAPKAVRRNW